MKQTRAREQRFLPWAHEAHGLKLVILGGATDGRSFGALDPRGQVLDLSHVWEQAQIQLEVRVPARVVRRVVAKQERDDPPVAVLLALRCDATNLRRRVGMRSWGEWQQDGLRFELQLEREMLAGSAELDVYLIRTRQQESTDSGFASRRGVRLASARTVVIQVDEPLARKGNYLDIQYRSFASAPNIPPSRRAAVYRLELERDEPILYLNEDHEHVRALLDSKGTRGSRARARDLLYERIGAGVWTQLVLGASTRLINDGEVAYAWEAGILAQWLPRLYPDEANEDERRARLERDYSRLPSLLAEIDGAIQSFNELGAAATKLADEL